MILFRAWEIRTKRLSSDHSGTPPHKVSFRHIEKSMLYLSKHIIQGIILVIVKYWFIGTTKLNKWLCKSWPKLYSLFNSDHDCSPTPPSFFQKTLKESKLKIRRIKEKVRRDHE